MTTTTKSMVGGFFALAMIAGCGGPLKYAPHGSEKAPEADGKIVADVHKSGSFTSLTVGIDHLAPAERLGGGTTFVLWTKAGDKPKWHRVGALSYDEGDRKAKIENASVPVLSFDLRVTVERTPDPEEPSETVILSQHVN